MTNDREMCECPACGRLHWKLANKGASPESLPPAGNEVGEEVWVGVDSLGHMHKGTVSADASGCRIECRQRMREEGDPVLVPRRALLSLWQDEGK